MSVENLDGFLNEDCLKDDESFTLLDLPVEIFLHICSFLDASTLVHGLGSTCKQFYEILCDDSLWKVRINQLWHNARYPVLPPDKDDELFWKQSCVSIEKHLSYWNDKNSKEGHVLPDGHFSSVDTLVLMDKGRFLITGGRDRSLTCWNLDSTQTDDVLYKINPMAHEGWIWDLIAVDEKFYSCSWDKTVKSWHLDHLHLTPVRKFEMDVTGALLCIASYPGVDVLATGSYCRTVILFDPRAGQAPIVRYRPHRRAILKLVMNDNYVLSASEDKTVSVWDQRAGRIMKTIEISKSSYPMSMIMDKGSVHVGDSSGNIYVLDPRKDFRAVKRFSSGHTKGIKGLRSTPGGLITGSLDNTVRFLSPTDPPQLITSLSGSVGEIAGMDYMDGVLAISGSNLQIWRPKTRSVIEDS